MKRILLIALLLLGCSPAWAQNYSATAGSGLTFGSKLVSTVQYPQIVFCDPTTPSQCVAVNSSGQQTVLSQSPSFTPSAAATPGNLTLTTGGTSQTLFAAAEVVHGCSIQNPSTATENIAINFTGGTASTTPPGPSMILIPGTSITCAGGNAPAITWVAATTSHTINAYKW